ncbi:hypothetical protein F511_28396 [Dorcoceras hygrometricum]|uniref:Uncharacterized protein n=1 Tax=Dorcoceras hygrometricum TaxID=472368 RepID=A0A2Z7ADH3_9LAMI|nr:hypothetical protein F511_28396 [Dorcoceras hygrometricum]
MRLVVNYHSSWARQQQVELFDASGNPGSIAGRGFNPAGGAPGGNPGSIAGRGFNPAGGAPGGSSGNQDGQSGGSAGRSPFP